MDLTNDWRTWNDWKTGKGQLPAHGKEMLLLNFLPVLPAEKGAWLPSSKHAPERGRRPSSGGGSTLQSLSLMKDGGGGGHIP